VLFKGAYQVQNEPTLLTISTDEFGVAAMKHWTQHAKDFDFKAAFFDILSPYFSYDKVRIL
jgi:phage I-like protein